MPAGAADTGSAVFAFGLDGRGVETSRAAAAERNDADVVKERDIDEELRSGALRQRREYIMGVSLEDEAHNAILGRMGLVLRDAAGELYSGRQERQEHIR